MSVQLVAANGISCHAFNADKTQVAICPNNNEIHLYETRTWTRLFVLAEHDLLVTSIDWSAINNKIVSCSHDRNAFVWTYVPASGDEPAKWNKALVLLRIDRAAMDVKWSLDGLRFAVASGAKCVPLCTYDAAGDWWVSKMIKKKIKSTVLCVAFHPTNGQLLATGCADFKCRVFSTYSADVDGEGPSFVNAGPFGAPVEFGEAYCELSALCWVNAVAWSPSGNVLAFAGHDSSIHFATFSPSGPVVSTVRFKDLPLNRLLFVSERAVVGGGHDFNPIVYTNDGSTWSLLKRLDERKEEKSQAATSGVSAARALFQNKTTRGQEAKSETDVLWTQHENAITDICICAPVRGGAVTKISTSGLDGHLVFFDIPSM